MGFWNIGWLNGSPSSLHLPWSICINHCISGKIPYSSSHPYARHHKTNTLVVMWCNWVVLDRTWFTLLECPVIAGVCRGKERKNALTWHRVLWVENSVLLVRCIALVDDGVLVCKFKCTVTWYLPFVRYNATTVYMKGCTYICHMYYVTGSKWYFPILLEVVQAWCSHGVTNCLCLFLDLFNAALPLLLHPLPLLLGLLLLHLPHAHCGQQWHLAEGAQICHKEWCVISLPNTYVCAVCYVMHTYSKVICVLSRTLIKYVLCFTQLDQ